MSQLRIGSEGMRDRSYFELWALVMGIFQTDVKGREILRFYPCCIWWVLALKESSLREGISA